MNNDVTRFRIGAFKCTLFRDLDYRYLTKDFFVNVEEEELRSVLRRYQEDMTGISSPFVTLLLETTNRKILTDTGVGYMDEPFTFRGQTFQYRGKLLELLDQENINRTSITHVIISHFHPDHIGGIFNSAKELNFPDAQYHMHQDEWDFWHSSKSDNQPPLFRYMIEKNITGLTKYNLHLFKGDNTVLLPGITAIKADGHTPGHVALAIHSQQERLLYVADTFPHPLHIERPDWETNYDRDQPEIEKSRLMLLDLAYRENMLVQAFHFAFPGLGRVSKVGNSWRWEYEQTGEIGAQSDEIPKNISTTTS